MSADACPHLPEPLQLPVTYHQVATNATGLAWGVDIQLGSPAQSFSLPPTLWDFTFVADAVDCIPPDAWCQFTLGGTYDKNLSTTSLKTVSTPWQNHWNGSIDFGDTLQYNLYNDVLTFGSNNLDVPGYPFATDAPGQFGAASMAQVYGSWLGLGTNSTFLKALVESGAAPSTSWGLLAGSRLSKPTIDGLLTIGGYDDAQVTGDFSTFDSRHNCPTCIHLEELTWVPETGSPIPLWHESLFDLDISIDPWSEYLFLPPTAFQAFGNSTGGVYNETYQSFTYPGSIGPKGDLKFAIKDGYSSSIPASQIFFPLFTYEENGTLGIYDDTLKLAQVQQYQNFDASSSARALFGIPFLLSNYIVMDIERSQFRLAEAVRDDQHVNDGSAAKKLCPKSFDSSTPHKKNVGAIVGGAVGGAVGISLIAIAFFLWHFRTKRRGRRATRQTEPPVRQLYHPIAIAHDARIRLVLMSTSPKC